MTAHGLLVAGTTSDAGKSLLVAGMCRYFSRQGVRVAPFKSQNMSNNSMVTPDGVEIGRAQWLQALAARAVPEAAMNPVLLKPGTDRTSHVVLMGRPHGRLGTGEWATGRRELAAAAYEAWDDLASRYEVVIAEGAGSPAEVNLRAGDYVNFGLAAEKSLPVVVVGDIDRGGVLAAMYGTWGIVDAQDRARITGWIVNKFRGDEALLRPGLDILHERTGVPVLGVVPWLADAWLDGEDALTIGAFERSGAGADKACQDRLTVAVVALSRISNSTDVDAFAAEPGVDVTVTRDPDVLARADLLVLPGSRSTLADLSGLRADGLGEVVAQRARAGRPVLGICGGYQMLAERVIDQECVEAPSPVNVEGLGLLPVQVVFTAQKHLGTPRGVWRGAEVGGYEIHHGTPVFTAPVDEGDGEAFLDGVRRGGVFGTHWHGAFENDAFRRAFLAEVSSRVGKGWVASSSLGFASRRERMLDAVADALTEHLVPGSLERVLGL
ncbi:cobyric acid synthase [Dermatophilus congolensis]|uniref:cobyric acid synthase n=1 Tax=Dermatophilus congolensis TaxID=1863 RepID=UPI00312C917C